VLILAFDTTAGGLSVALLNDDKIIALTSVSLSNSQSQLLIPEIEKILREQKIWYQDLGLIAATNGPGSFTGSRIGLSCARIIKAATNLPLILVNGLEAMAFKYRGCNKNIFIALDASGDEFFCAEFRESEIVQEPCLIKAAELAAIAPEESFFLCGSGKKAAAEILKNQQFESSEGDDVLSADVVGLLGLEKFKNGEVLENLDPLYLRGPRIEARKK
jgi:tRNA threonylcarbamoyladenosine biosynthesis protein TsaB